MFDELSVAENIYVGRHPTRGAVKGLQRIDWNTIEQEAERLDLGAQLIQLRAAAATEARVDAAAAHHSCWGKRRFQAGANPRTVGLRWFDRGGQKRKSRFSLTTNPRFRSSVYRFGSSGSVSRSSV